MRVIKYLLCFLILFFIQQLLPQSISWERTNGPYGGFISVLYQSSSGKIYAGARGLLYCKYSNDEEWNLTLRTNTCSSATTIVENSEGEIYASFGIGTYRSSDNGITWELMNSGISGLTLNKLTIDDQDNLYISSIVSNSFKIYKSTDDGLSWNIVFEYTPTYANYSTIKGGNNGLILAALNSSIIFRTTNYGQVWETIILPSFTSLDCFHIKNNGEIYASDVYDIWKSTNLGATWFLLSTAPIANWIKFIKSDSSDNLYLGLSEINNQPPNTGGVFKSTDDGQTWNDLTLNLLNRHVISVEFVDENRFWIGTKGKGIFELSWSDSVWMENNVGLNDLNINSIAIDELNNAWLCTSRGGIFYTSDTGNNWIEKSAGLIFPSGYEIKISDDNYVFLADHNGLYRYDGANKVWVVKLMAVGMGNDGIKCVEIKDNDTIFAGSINSGIATSYDNGENWFWKPPYLLSTIKALQNRSVLAAGGWGVYKSMDNGLSWQSFYSFYDCYEEKLEQTMESYVLTPCNISSTNSGYLYLSTDNGLTHTRITENINSPFILCVKSYTNNRIFIGTNDQGIFLTTNYGNDWQQLNEGLDNLSIRSLAIDEFGYIYAGTSEGLYKSTSNIITDNSTKDLLIEFSLSQNYPNPFNPTTKVEFRIADFGFVSMKVFDVLGTEITTLVNEEKQVGEYEVEFDGSNLPSGVYFYQLKSGNYIETKKMLLMK